MHLSGQSIDDSFDECLEIVLKPGLSVNAMAIEALSRHLDIRTMLVAAYARTSISLFDQASLNSKFNLKSNTATKLISLFFSSTSDLDTVEFEDHGFNHFVPIVPRPSISYERGDISKKESCK